MNDDPGGYLLWILCPREPGDDDKYHDGHRIAQDG
jgi:hypothetical protein